MARAGVHMLLLGAALSQVLLSRRVEAVRVNTDVQEEIDASGADAVNVSRRDSLDWSSTNNPSGRSMVTPAGFQGGKCNSCYIFAAIGSIESRAAIRAGGSATAQTLSVQQALDCVNADHMRQIGKGAQVYLQARGCQTGFPKPIMQYAIAEGFMTAADYPVQYDQDASFTRDKEEKQCLVDTGKIAVQASATVREISGLRWVEKAVAALETGPIAISIDKSSYTIGTTQVVRGGAIAPKDCASKNMDHAVLLVGYGKQDGREYWIIKNSWGTAWGQDGFFKIPKGVNFCGAESSGVYLDFTA